MRLTRLGLRDFRNIESLDLPTDAQFVVLHGDNAQGKTNTLEAIYLLATLKSLRARRPGDLVRWGTDEAAIAGTVEHDGLERKYRLDVSSGGRKVSLDGKTVHDLGSYFDGIRAIAFTPDDVAVVRDEPKVRRRWLDRAAFTARPLHLELVRTYGRLLDQKSAVLRGRVDFALLDVLDGQIAKVGADLAHRREALLGELLPHVRAVHRDIAGEDSELTLTYRTCAPGSTLEERRSALAQTLADKREEAVRRARVVTGPQLDDVRIALDDKPSRTFASQGQVRSIVLSLKLGELIAARARGDSPLFLIDDVSSELDAGRTQRLVDVLEDLGVQVFATTTDPAHLGRLPPSDTMVVRVRAGVLRSR